MSTLWTPSGEHRIPKPDEAGPVQGAQGSPAEAHGGVISPTEPDASPEELSEAQAELDAMRAQLLETPVEVVIANHAMGMWELAALHLSSQPPQLVQAQLAIDALTALVDGLQGRWGEAEKTLQDGLAQIRMAYVQIHKASRAAAGQAPTGDIED